MERIARLPGSRLAEIRREHPEAVICRVDGVLHAWVELASGGTEAHAYDEDELAAKLDGPGG